MQQRTDEWFSLRAGKVTASRIGDLMAKTKTGYGASRANYIAQLVCERITGQPQAQYTNGAMQWGTDTEPAARAAYEALSGCLIEEVGFVPHPTIAMAGASPDGRIDADGLLEIKCPNTATHIETVLGAPIDRKYILQMQWQMDCDRRDYCIFVSYDPRCPEPIQLHWRKVERDDKLIAEIREEVEIALAEVGDKVRKLKEMM